MLIQQRRLGMANVQVPRSHDCHMTLTRWVWLSYPEASGGKRVTTFPISAPGSSTNLPTSAVLVDVTWKACRLWYPIATKPLPMTYLIYCHLSACASDLRFTRDELTPSIDIGIRTHISQTYRWAWQVGVASPSHTWVGVATLRPSHIPLTALKEARSARVISYPTRYTRGARMESRCWRASVGVAP